jgi:trehalose 6-phosphate synthase
MGERMVSGAGATWTPDKLRTWLATHYSGASIIVVANREPVRHDHTPDGTIVVRRSAGGLVTALEPLMQACSGVWVAHGAGTADRIVVERQDGLRVSTADLSYRLRRVWLDSGEEQGYYYGFSNEGLWPLCHRTSVRPIFRAADFSQYTSANQRFADAVCEESETDSPLVLVQDYHLALAPGMIRRRLPHSTVITFWHIPFPGPRDLEVCPWRRELLEGLLGSSTAGFQTPEDCSNFLDAAHRHVGASITPARNAVMHRGRQVLVRAYPVSIEWPNRWTSQSPPVATCRTDVRRQLDLPSDISLAVGVDRLDYTKGINEKFLAVERFLETHPEFCERFAFVQIAEPSRHCLPAYRDLRLRLRKSVERINRRFGSGGRRPIVLLEARHEPDDVYRFFRAADACYVGSLHDGMNLVAKEFVSARDDARGVLILSKFAGAARELSAALVVDPYAVDECASALATALTMSEEEQAVRMRTMRAHLSRFNGYRWAAAMLADAAPVRSQPRELRLRNQYRMAVGYAAGRTG